MHSFFHGNQFGATQELLQSKTKSETYKKMWTHLIKYPSTGVTPVSTSLSDNHQISAWIIPMAAGHYSTLWAYLFIFLRNIPCLFNTKLNISNNKQIYTPNTFKFYYF